MAKQTGVCVYCGQTGPLTADHVPPKTLWSKPRPSDLVTVPSCNQCNHGASKDDEYFRTAIVIKEPAGSHPDASTIRESLFRALASPNRAGFRQHIIQNTSLVPVQTAAGIYLGRVPVLNVDLRRLDRVVERVTKGLYWHHHNHNRLPDDCHVKVWSEEGLRDVRGAQRVRIQQLVASTLSTPTHTLARNVLRYWYAHGDREHLTAWIYQFYDDVRFLAITVPS